MTNATSTQLNPPIFVWEPRDLVAFSTIDEACHYVEPEDVERVIGFDSAGTRFHFAVAPTPIRVSGRNLWARKGVVVDPTQMSRSNETELKDILCTALTAARRPIDNAAPLQELIRLAGKVFKVNQK